MFKKIVLAAGLSALVFAAEVKEHIYDVMVDVSSSKIDKMSWDISGGAPDILLRVDGVTLAFDPQCRDTYRCTLSFTSNTQESWYLEVYDKDIASDDLVGKGNCVPNKPCSLGLATVMITQRRPLTLADARMDTAQLNESVSHQIDLLILQTKNSNQINPSELTRLAGSIETIRS
jgi:hypothetical protein